MQTPGPIQHSECRSRPEPSGLYFSRNGTLEPLGIHVVKSEKVSALRILSVAENGDQSQAMTARHGKCSVQRNGGRRGGRGFPQVGMAELRPKRRVRAKVCRQREQLVQKLRGEMEHELPWN